jgi:hypothetical protein
MAAASAACKPRNSVHAQNFGTYNHQRQIKHAKNGRRGTKCWHQVGTTIVIHNNKPNMQRLGYATGYERPATLTSSAAALAAASAAALSARAYKKKANFDTNNERRGGEAS